MGNKKTEDTHFGNQGESSSNSLTEEAKIRHKVAEKTIYDGFFIDPKELYGKYPPSLKNVVKDPHVTLKFRPNERETLIDAIGTEVKILILGYGNDGKNEGLLVKIVTDDPALQKQIDEIPVQHITLSYGEDCAPKDTADIEYTLFEREEGEEPDYIMGRFGHFIKGGAVVSSLEDFADK